MPVQVEKEIIEYLKKGEFDFSNAVDDCCAYLESMDTIVTDHCFTSVNIGDFNANEIDIILRLCASHYRYAFQNKVNSYPYFA